MKVHVTVFKAGRYDAILDDPWEISPEKDRQAGSVIRNYLECGDFVLIRKVTEEST